MTTFFWSHYYTFLAGAAVLLLVVSSVALIRKWIKGGEFVSLLLEVIVIVMIGVELKEGYDQGRILDALNTSANATALALQDLQKAQQDSAGTLGKMNDSARQQAQTTKSMNGVLQQQLAILSDEQKAQLEQAKLHPVPLIMLLHAEGEHPGLVPISMSSVVQVPGQQEGYQAALSFYVRNIGTAPFRRPKISARVGYPNQYVCIEFPSFSLASTFAAPPGSTIRSQTCDPTVSVMETIPDIAPNPVTTLILVSSDLGCRVVSVTSVVFPNGAQDFELS